jgi:hypothetical protein
MTFYAILLLAVPAPARAQQCQPGIDTAWDAHRPDYDLLWAGLTPHLDSLLSLLNTVSDQASYATLVGAARSVAGGVPHGRVVVTLPDGTVVVDTWRVDGETPANANSYAHFLSKSINENLNSRVAMMAAQLFPCGIAVETRISTTTGNVESQFAARLGQDLNSSGTARLSMVVGGPCFGCWDY